MHFSDDSSLKRGTLEFIFWMALRNHMWMDHVKELQFRKTALIGPLEVGLCTWSNFAEGTRDMFEVVAYVAETKDGKFYNPLVTLSSTTDPHELAKTILTPLPKKRWWHKRNYSPKRLVEFTVEEALMEVQKWAETRIGLTNEQQNLISEAVQMSAIRNRVLYDLDLLSGKEDESTRVN